MKLIDIIQIIVIIIFILLLGYMFITGKAFK